MGLLHIYVPRADGGPDDLVVASRDLADDLAGREAADEDEEEDEDEDTAGDGARSRLVPFGCTDNGLVACWHRDEPSFDQPSSAEGELWIYLVALGGGRRPRRAAPTLGALLFSFLEARYQNPLLASTHQLPWTFEAGG